MIFKFKGYLNNITSNTTTKGDKSATYINGNLRTLPSEINYLRVGVKCPYDGFDLNVPHEFDVDIRTSYKNETMYTHLNIVNIN